MFWSVVILLCLKLVASRWVRTLNLSWRNWYQRCFLSLQSRYCRDEGRQPPLWRDWASPCHPGRFSSWPPPSCWSLPGHPAEGPSGHLLSRATDTTDHQNTLVQNQHYPYVTRSCNRRSEMYTSICISDLWLKEGGKENKPHLRVRVCQHFLSCSCLNKLIEECFMLQLYGKRAA